MIGDRLHKARIAANKTLEEVAKIIGTTRQTVQKYETGIITNIPSDKIESLATALNVSPAYLMGWDDNDENTTRPSLDERGMHYLEQDQRLEIMLETIIGLPDNKTDEAITTIMNYLAVLGATASDE